MVSKELLTPQEAAEAMSVSRSRIYELVAAGALRSVTIGRSRRVPAKAITDFIAELEARAMQEPVRPSAHY